MEDSTSESCFAFSDVKASHSDSESEASEVNVSEVEAVNVNSLLDRLKCPKPSDLSRKIQSSSHWRKKKTE